MKSFEESVFVLGMRDATYFATDLFFEAFRSAFPVPRDNSGLSIPTPPEIWRQYVAFYKWSGLHVEPIAFVNLLRYRDVYLVGGLCARRHFYRRLPPEQWDACKKRGGIVQILLETVDTELNDATALFGYCGDAKSWRVSERVGYRRTRHPNQIVKWLRDLPEDRRHVLEDQVAAIGRF